MPDKQVSLELAKQDASPGTGWAAADQTGYWFRYTGDVDGQGNVHVNAGANVIVTLADTDTYRVAGVSLTDTNGDVDQITLAADKVTFEDTDAHPGYDIYFGIRVRDKAAGKTVTCDPEIHNEG